MLYSNGLLNVINPLQLKEALLSAPVLVFPQTDEEFLLEVDASKYAVGGVLSQKQSDSSIHPIAYFSTSLTKTQQNWSPYSQAKSPVG